MEEGGMEMDSEQNGTPKKSLWKRLREGFLTLMRLIFNPHLLLCFGIAWLITNGWAYIVLGIGTYVGSAWMIGIASFYLTLLWFPFTPEKIITVIIAIWLLTRLFPSDQKTLAVLHKELNKLKAAVRKRKNKKKKEDTSPSKSDE